MADKLFIGSIYALPVLFLFFISFPIFNWPRTIIFYIGILISLPVSIYLIYINYISAKNIQHLIIKGIICNIVGVIITVLMIERYNQGIREYAFDDYPLLYMRIGILAEVFFYQLAILRKWNEQEQLLATKDIQNKLEISNVKNQISRELHDDVGTTLSKINLQSFMAQNKIKEENFNIVDTLKAIQNESQELIQRIKNLIWTVDEATQDFNLIKKVEEYGKAMCDSKDIQFNIFKDSNMVENLGIENKYNLLMICREAINNSVKYSQASTLQIKFFETEDHLMVSVNDNGIGLKNINSGEGLGLTNMKHRAMQLNGTISFITRNGFEVNLSIPL